MIQLIVDCDGLEKGIRLAITFKFHKRESLCFGPYCMGTSKTCPVSGKNSIVTVSVNGAVCGTRKSG